MNKKELRKEILARRMRLSEQECSEKSKVIAEKLIQLEEFKKSDKVLLYAPIRNEVETKEICYEARRLRKNIYYPKVMGKEMSFYLVDESTEFEISTYGICEPKPESTILLEPKREDEILIVMPGAVFDRVGNRIGYGGGYYDKYLCWLEGIVPREQTHKVAIAYECQMVDVGMIENESHDIRVDFVITENGDWRRMS